MPRLHNRNASTFKWFHSLQQSLGTERQHAGKAKMSKPSYREKYDGILNKSSEHNYTRNYLYTAPLRKTGSFLPINTLKCACATCLFNWSIKLTVFFHSKPGEVRDGGAAGCDAAERSQVGFTCAARCPARWAAPSSSGLFALPASVGLRTALGELLQRYTLKHLGKPVSSSWKHKTHSMGNAKRFHTLVVKGFKWKRGSDAQRCWVELCR